MENTGTARGMPPLLELGCVPWPAWTWNLLFCCRRRRRCEALLDRGQEMRIHNATRFGDPLPDSPSFSIGKSAHFGIADQAIENGGHRRDRVFVVLNEFRETALQFAEALACFQWHARLHQDDTAGARESGLLARTGASE